VVNRLSGEKQQLAVDYATYALDGESVIARLAGIQQDLYERSRAEVLSRIFEVESYDEFRQVIAGGRGFALAAWDGTTATEERVKEETSATTRVLLAEPPENNVKCLFSDGPAKYRAYFAASY
jgi:prolyl-tRNA synthetase